MTHDEMTRRAFEIADDSMLSLLECHAMRADEYGNVWSFLDKNGHEVNTLAEADPAIIEAINWLQDRGLGELIDDPHGECFLVKAD